MSANDPPVKEQYRSVRLYASIAFAAWSLIIALGILAAFAGIVMRSEATISSDWIDPN